MRVTQKGQVTIPLEVRRALGIGPGSEVEFELDEEGARLHVNADQAAAQISRIRSAAQAI
jgi:AbrB family looped-hinge helix DNA binding protein